MNKEIEYSDGWYYHKKCNAYLVYFGAGYFHCDKCAKEFHYKDCDMPKTLLIQYYEDKNEMEERVIDSE